MATHDSSEHPEEQQPQQPQTPPGQKRVPLNETQKKRLQKCFDLATKQMEQGNHEYATELFTPCVLGDPMNLSYSQSFLKNLQKKYSDNKKGHPLAAFKERGARGAIKKGVEKSDWDDVVKNGVAVLKVNPWDVPALTGMATATAGILAEVDGSLGDCELFYLKAAFEANPKDADVCRLVATALGKRQRFDEAIAFWHKVEQLHPGDEDAQRQVSTLAVQKQMKQAPRQIVKDAQPTAHTPGSKQAQEELSQEEQLKKAIRRDPNNLSNYHDLSQIYLDASQYKEAEEVLSKAYKVSNNDPDVFDKLEDVRLRGLRHVMVAAEKKARESAVQVAKAEAKKASDQTKAELKRRNEEAKAEYKRAKKEVIQKELAVWKSRCERYPTNMMFRYEVGLRHQLLGEYSEAIKEFQAAKNDPRKKGMCLLSLGECFRYIKQYKLAGRHYAEAIEEIPDRDADNKKLALYRAGKLAFDLQEWETAEKNLGVLAALDFSYRDVSALLDKISEKRND